MKHFESLWEDAENITANTNESVIDVLDHLSKLIDLYKSVNEKTKTAPSFGKELKLKALGGILLDLTKISRLDQINVYKALKTEIDLITIDNIEEKNYEEPQQGTD